MSETSPLVMVVPAEVDDPASPSGGNTYDQRVLAALRGIGCTIVRAKVAGTWPRPDTTARTRLARTLGDLADGTVTLVDGLVACGVPDVILPHARRLRLSVLVHLPLAEETGLSPAEAARLDANEHQVVNAARTVIVTSRWAARHLRKRHGIPADRLYVAEPGTDPAPPAHGSLSGTRLVCVAALTPRKGQDTLIAALARTRDLPWECWLVGPTDRVPPYTDGLRRAIHVHGLLDRVRLLGPRSGPDLAACYHQADLVVLPSYAETFGMVVTEALARGLPVLTTAGGALPDTLGRGRDPHRPSDLGRVPGIVVAPGDVTALSNAIRRWLTEPDTRQDLRDAAALRRRTLEGWEETARCVANALDRTREE